MSVRVGWKTTKKDTKQKIGVYAVMYIRRGGSKEKERRATTGGNERQQKRQEICVLGVCALVGSNVYADAR